MVLRCSKSRVLTLLTYVIFPFLRCPGLAPKVFEEGGPGGVGFSVGRPTLTPAQTIEYIHALAMELYNGNQKKLPKIYTVGYGADLGGEAFLQALARDFHGRYRKIRGLAPPVKDK
jgi:hypothetical protein